MRDEKIVTVRRADYKPPDWLVDRIELVIDLDPQSTAIESTLAVRRNPVVPNKTASLVLDGEAIQLVGVDIDGGPRGDWQLNEGALSVPVGADSAVVRVRNTLAPDCNTGLMGLYVSHGNLFTQCEAEGFRRITYFPDRPDVMSVYSVTLRADRERFPVLLANGNLADQGQLRDGRHWARWDDPFPKPSYLFALVAGRFACVEDRWRTRSGREVLLQLWTAPADVDKTAHAMRSLKRALEWDESRFGLELDLDRFMVVASHDFNMGAMENKGLNIFNAKYVLANPAVATDTDYANIESVVGHEYFHNWTGNRVTCRDWFQLSLKEGLTVFRDQEFSADMLAQDAVNDAGDDGRWARAVKRIDTVRSLRAMQFPEDAGPMAHPVRPDAYQEIGNFYTATVYEKGAEVVRMLQTLVGREGFRRGIDLYFQRHDGQAVTCDDFVAAISDANAAPLGQFARWYAQSGTPRVAVNAAYDPQSRTFELTLTQSCPPTPAQPDKLPFHVPFAVGLVGPDGIDLPLRLEGETAGETSAGARTRVLHLTEPTQTFRFVDVTARPAPSLARDFSAPVVVEYRYEDSELAFLAGHDSDGFNRWDAGQRLALARVSAATDAIEAGRAPTLDDVLVGVCRHLLEETRLAPSFKEQALQLPSESFVAEQRAVVDPQAIRDARQFVRRELGKRLADEFDRAYEDHAVPGPYSPDANSAGRRALRNLALAYLVESGASGAVELARHQLESAMNMTDVLAALTIIVNSSAPFKVDTLLKLARPWRHEPLLMNKWFGVQATAIALPGEPSVVDRVRTLTRHEAFALANPNNVYALVIGFCANNPAEFHRRDGSGYAFWTEHVLALDRINPTVAARLARALDRWRKFTPDRQRLMREALDEVARAPDLSRDVREIVEKSRI